MPDAAVPNGTRGLRKWRCPGPGPGIKLLKFDGERAILTFTFGPEDAALPFVEPISWDTFFALFDLLELSMTLEETFKDFCIIKVRSPSSSTLVP